MDSGDLRYVIFGYGLPAEMGLATLVGMGVKPESLLVVTHEHDARNAGFRSFVSRLGVAQFELSPNHADVQSAIAAHEPDIILSLHYRLRVPGSILRIARVGAMNLHPSLLPLYRGAFSIPWVLINAERETGFTYHVMEDEFDTGDIVLQQVLRIEPRDTALSLYNRQVVAGIAALPDAIRHLTSGGPFRAQRGSGSYYPRQVPNGGLIDASWDRDLIDRFIRAMYFPPFLGAEVELAGVHHVVNSIQDYDAIAPRE